MAYFEWGPDLEIDHGPIDADHRQLVELVNELHTATSQGQGQEVVASVMERLISYTRQHFTREEQGMEAAAFPGLAAHREKHHAITAQLQALQAQLQPAAIDQGATAAALAPRTP